MVRRLLILPLFFIACRQELPESTPAPPAPVARTRTTQPAPKRATYREAGDWFSTTRGFRFAMRSDAFDVEGAMVRTTPGAERVRFVHGGQEWLGAAERTGVVWYTPAGGGWEKAPPPPFADQIYQRATLWFDPRKVEGDAQAVESGYRFTDANSGDRYDITVDSAGRIAKVVVTGARPFTMSLTQHDEMVNIDAPRN